MNKEKGITIISLVITIIVLIILAGISVNTLIGENGIIIKAREAKENIILARQEESKKLNELYSQLHYMGEDIGNTDNEAIERLVEFKRVIATAITEEGVNTLETDTAETMAENIGKILQERTKEATATVADIASGKTAWVNGEMIMGEASNYNQISIIAGQTSYKASNNYSTISVTANVTEGGKYYAFWSGASGGGAVSPGEITISNGEYAVLKSYTNSYSLNSYSAIYEINMIDAGSIRFYKSTGWSDTAMTCIIFKVS